MTSDAASTGRGDARAGGGQRNRRVAGCRLLHVVALAALVASACAGSDSGPPPPDASGLAAEVARHGGEQPHPELAGAIRAALPVWQGGPLGTLTPHERTELARFYEAGGYAPVWLDVAGRLAGRAHEALALLAAAAGDGLEPTDYAAGALSALAASSMAPPFRPDNAAALDITLSAAMLRYVRHLHFGRVDPRAAGFEIALPPDRHQAPTLLRDALARRDLAQAVTDLGPKLAQYRLLREALRSYRALARDAAFAPLTPPARPVRPGDVYPGLDAVRQRLAAFGDLPASTPAPDSGAPYGEPLASGVRRFQARHGLEPDGVIGPATHAALGVPLAWRVRQIELALERLRWLPDPSRGRLLALNIPMFRLWGWDAIPGDDRPSFGMRAIVGRAFRTQTPVMLAHLEHVVFRPYWNVPRSILLSTILPAIERDPGYLAREQMEIVRGAGDAAEVVPATAESLALLRQGALRLRQRPGSHNALGLAAFVFPNDRNILLHGTPQHELFARARRDFSRGCVRVEDPVRLARWVLSDRPEWSEERILAAMAGPAPRRVHLAAPIPVVLFYVTAIVMPEDGAVHFAEDIYGHDARLDRALARTQPGGPGRLHR